MATKLQVYNMAISAARGRGTLTSLADNTREREECDKWFELIVCVAQEAAYWPFCKQSIVLNNPTKIDYDHWTYSYALPHTFLRAWYLENLTRFEIVDSRLLSNIESGLRLFFAAKMVDPQTWSPSFTQAVVYALASKLASPLTGKSGLVANLIASANQMLLNAQANSLASSGNFVPRYIPEFFSARGITSFNETAFYYPLGESFTVDS